MFVASYISTRPGLQGLANRVIRWRFGGQVSHTELVFEPGDGVDQFMPDGSCAPIGGALWSASSVAIEAMPAWSHKRAGEIGGVRFKRIAFEADRWLLIPIPGEAVAAAAWFQAAEGSLYDWSLVVKYAAFFMPQRERRYACSEAVADSLEFPDAWRFDPCTLTAAARRLSMEGRRDA